MDSALTIAMALAFLIGILSAFQLGREYEQRRRHYDQEYEQQKIRNRKA